MARNEIKLIAQRYRVISPLGGGGMGQVFKCHDLELKRDVAVKLLLSSASDEAIMRFHSEAKALAHLNHKNILLILDFGQCEDGQPYLVMEYIKGTSLSNFLAQKGPIDLSEALPIFEQLCAGLSYAHAQGVLHRDIKPSNVMMIAGERAPVVKLVDFGLAKIIENKQNLTRQGTTMGSPPYMSPEVVQGRVVDERSDIYSLGCLFFEVLTGHPPFEGPTAVKTMMMHLSASPKALSQVIDREFPADVEDMVKKCLQKSPDDRYLKAEDVLSELRRLIESMAVAREMRISDAEAPPLLAVQPSNRLFKRRMTILIIVFLCVLIIAFLKITEPNRSKSKAISNHSMPLLRDFKKAEGGYLSRAEVEFKNYEPGLPLCIINSIEQPSDQEMRELANSYKLERAFRFCGFEMSRREIEYFREAQPAIEIMQLESGSLGAGALQEISQMKKLRRLSINCLNGLTPEGVKALARLKALEALKITINGPAGQFIEAISALSNLRYLELTAIEINDGKQLMPLASIKNLSSLKFRKSRFAPDAFNRLWQLKRLKTLEFAEQKQPGRRADKKQDEQPGIVLEQNLVPEQIDDMCKLKIEKLCLNEVELNVEDFLRLATLRDGTVLILKDMDMHNSVLKKLHKLNPRLRIESNRSKE